MKTPTQLTLDKITTYQQQLFELLVIINNPKIYKAAKLIAREQYNELSLQIIMLQNLIFS